MSTFEGLRLAIGTPTYNGTVQGDFTGSLVETQRVLGAAGAAGFEFLIISGTILPSVRADVLAAALDCGASHLLCVDADIGWHAPDVLRLVAHGQDMVTGVYETRGADESGRSRHCIAHPRAARDAPGLLEVDACGFGFVLLSRRCMERMRDAWGLYQSFAYVMTGELGLQGEDYGFCARWRGLGGKVYADPVPRLRHHGRAVFNMTWQEAQQRGRPRASRPIPAIAPPGPPAAEAA